MNALAFGEILWDKIEDEFYLGGAPLNFAAHFVKCGGQSSIISAVGNDALGKRAIADLTSLAVDASFVHTLANHDTGTVDVILSNGEPDYAIHEPVAFDFIVAPETARLSKVSCDVFYFGTLAQRNAVSRDALRCILDTINCHHIFYDINIRKNFFTREIVWHALERCTIFKINNDEVKILSQLFYKRVLLVEEFASRVAKDFNIDVVIVSAGENGAYIQWNNAFRHIPGVATTVVDAVGAGDAFSAAFMYRYCNGDSAFAASTIANAVGSFVAASRGAIPAYTNELKKRITAF